MITQDNLNYVILKSTSCTAIIYRNNIWFSQKQLVNILGRKLSTINEHIKAIEKVIPDSFVTLNVSQIEGSRNIKRNKLYYNLGFVFSLGIRTKEYEKTNLLIEECKFHGITIDEIKVVPFKEREFCKMVIISLAGICEFEEQFSIGKYRVDLFCSKLQLAIEYDESHHKKPDNLFADIIRQQKIESAFPNIHFIRVSEDEEYLGLNKIIKFVFNQIEKPIFGYKL